MDLIELRDIHKTYHLGEVDVPVLKGISLRVAQGELVALMGTSARWRKLLPSLHGQGPSSVRPFERFGHRPVEVVDKIQTALA